MKKIMRRVAREVADAIHEMNEAQRLMLVMRTAPDRYAMNPDDAPDTYAEFLTRTSGILRHEPPARKRIRQTRAHG